MGVGWRWIVNQNKNDPLAPQLPLLQGPSGMARALVASWSSLTYIFLALTLGLPGWRALVDLLLVAVFMASAGGCWAGRERVRCLRLVVQLLW